MTLTAKLKTFRHTYNGRPNKNAVNIRGTMYLPSRNHARSSRHAGCQNR